MKKVWLQSLQAYLSYAFIALLLLAIGVASGFVFYQTYQATHELQDDLLKQTAQYTDPLTIPSNLNRSDNDARIFIQTPSTPQSDAHRLLLPSQEQEGFHTVFNHGDVYRIYVHNTSHGPVVVMQENDYREDLAQKAAWSSAIPFLLLLPLIILATIYIVRKTLRPIQDLSGSIENRLDTDLSKLDLSKLPYEIQGFVSSINQLFERVEQSMQQQQRFIADAAHELRSPMTALSIQADRLSKQQLSEPVSEQVMQLQHIIQRHRELLEQLLSLAKAQSGQFQRDYHEIQLAKLFQHVIEDVYPLASVKGQDIGVVSQTNVTILADETEIYTLIKTFVDNAIRYTPDDSQIDLAVAVDGEWVVISVEDNGLGIPENEYLRVLDPFYRIVGTGKQGTGLGLSIAAAIVQHYGGHIDCKSSLHFNSGLRVEAYLNKFILIQATNK